jgi:hypothetical protein
MNNIIHVYSRAQALEDGVLVDVSSVAREAGIRYPTVLTRAAWERYVQVPPGVEAQDEAGRLWDVLWMLRVAIAQNRPTGCELRFTLLVRNDNHRPQLVTLKSVCGPGDDLEPVITVMLPDED